MEVPFAGFVLIELSQIALTDGSTKFDEKSYVMHQFLSALTFICTLGSYFKLNSLCGDRSLSRCVSSYLEAWMVTETTACVSVTARRDVHMPQCQSKRAITGFKKREKSYGWKTFFIPPFLHVRTTSCTHECRCRHHSIAYKLYIHHLCNYWLWVIFFASQYT